MIGVVSHSYVPLTFVGSCRDRHFSLRVELPAEERTVRICNGLLQPWSTLGWRILVTFYSVERSFCSFNNELWRIVAAESKSEDACSNLPWRTILTKSLVPYSLLDIRAVIRRLPDDSPMGCFGEAAAASLTIDQTSCF